MSEPSSPEEAAEALQAIVRASQSRSKPTIHELEEILKLGDQPIEILPNGEIAVGKIEAERTAIAAYIRERDRAILALEDDVAQEVRNGMRPAYVAYVFDILRKKLAGRMSDDIVADLDHWIRGAVQSDPHLILQRARDEIAALREALAEEADRSQGFADSIHDKACAEERERCARICERMGQYSVGVGAVGFPEAFMEVCATLAAAIRAEKIGKSEERTTAPKAAAAEG